MSEIKYIKWAELEKEIEGWESVEVPDGSKVYFKVNDRGDKAGFDFKQVNRVSYSNENQWEPKDDYEVLLNGVALFDGIRHLYFGDERSDNFGYYYYPNLVNIRQALKVLELIEDEHSTKD